MWKKSVEEKENERKNEKKWRRIWLNNKKVVNLQM
jgi:hypothetical protein